MAKLNKILISLAMTAALTLPGTAMAQRNRTANSHRGEQTQRTSGRSASQQRGQTSVRSTSQQRPGQSSQTRQSTHSRQKEQAAGRPANSAVTRTGRSTVRSSAYGTRPTGTRTGKSTQPTGTRPGKGSNLGNGNSKGHNGGDNRNRHDNGHGNSYYRHGGHNGNRQHHGGGNSVHRPGEYRPGPRPHYNYCRPGYRPPRPGGGYWGAPPVNIYRPVYYLPPVPPRPAYVSYTVPTIGNILGLAFGSFIDAGINALFNNGYNVLGYVNNAVYIGNVRQLGFIWPEATVYYTDGLMSNTQFQYWTQAPDVVRFNNVYAQLAATYGAPVSSNTSGGITTVSWWGGNNTGYITLQYGPGASASGLTSYYTTLTYSDGY